MTAPTPPNPWSFGPSDYIRATCHRCGARKESTAERKCKPWQDITGEYVCPTDGFVVDADGYFTDVSTKAIRRADREWDAWLATDDGREWLRIVDEMAQQNNVVK